MVSGHRPDSSTLLARRSYPGGGVFETVIGDLLSEKVDAVVNAANGRLVHGGGVAAAISRAAGPALDEEGRRLVAEKGPVPTGGAAATGAGKLPFKGVIHAVGPRGSDAGAEDLLVSALAAAFGIAHERGWRSLALPAVSSGIFAVPLDVCARAYRRAADEFFSRRPGSPLALIRLVLRPGPLAELVRREMEEERR